MTVFGNRKMADATFVNIPTIIEKFVNIHYYNCHVG